MATAILGATLHTYPLSERFRLLPHVIWARDADAIVIFDGDRGRYYTLNEVAGRIWELLVAGEPLVEIMRALQDEYKADAAILEADVASLVDRLTESALIQRVPT